MKKCTIILVSTIFLISCNTSKEDKVNGLIAEGVKKTLIFPDSYDPIETKIDSAFSPVDDPEFIDLCVKIGEMATDIMQYEAEMEQAQTTMAIYSSRSSNFEKNQFDKAKNNYNHIKNILDGYKKNIENLTKNKVGIIDTNRTFVGYKAVHTYRAQNNAGQLTINKSFFYFDKEIKAITGQLDEESYAYKTYEEFLRSATQYK